MTRKSWGECSFKLFSDGRFERRYTKQSSLQASKIRLSNYIASQKPARRKEYADNSRKLKLWAIDVRKRDVLCQHCGAFDNLHAHHIKPKSLFSDMMFDVCNGILLCRKCHTNAHKNDQVWNLMASTCG